MLSQNLLTLLSSSYQIRNEKFCWAIREIFDHSNFFLKLIKLTVELNSKVKESENPLSCPKIMLAPKSYFSWTRASARLQLYRLWEATTRASLSLSKHERIWVIFELYALWVSSTLSQQGLGTPAFCASLHSSII